MKKLLSTTLLAATLISTPAAIHARSVNPDIVDTAITAGSFETLVTALQAADLVDTLKGRGPYTVFAPSDQAFAKLPAGTVDTLLKPENSEKLTAILTYHVVSGRVPASQATNLRSATTLNGQRLDISSDRGRLFIDDSQVVQADITAGNGVIHVIDDVLLPSEEGILEIAQSAGSFNTLVKALQAAGLIDALRGKGPFTVFAPSDEAFAQLPKGTIANLLQPENRDRLTEILTYHVIPERRYADGLVSRATFETLSGIKLQAGFSDGELLVNNSRIVSPDIEGSNGVIHVIDRVLLPDPERSAAIDASELIELAINRGVPLFNEGQTAACAAIYEVATLALLNMGEAVPSTTRTSLKQSLEAISRQTHPRDIAWTLRRGLDEALGSLNGTIGM